MEVACSGRASLEAPSPQGESSPLSWEPGLLLSPASLSGPSESRAAPDLVGREDTAEEEGREAGPVGEVGVSGMRRV